MTAIFDVRAAKAVPAEFFLISGSHDTQMSADISSNAGTFNLPDPAGQGGGVCTSAMLQVLESNDGSDMSWATLLRTMRTVLVQKGYDQMPQLTSSRMIDVNKSFFICPPNFKGTKRAVLIGINYTGQQGELSDCHNDVVNFLNYLKGKEGFNESDCIVLMDDNKHDSPTMDNIVAALTRMTFYAVAGDVVVVHYSGHGDCFCGDDGGIYKSLVPVDYQKAGQIRDGDLTRILIQPMKAGVHVTCLMDDCCHSASTIVDMPYRFTADGDVMTRNESVNFSKLQGSSKFLSWFGCCL